MDNIYKGSKTQKNFTVAYILIFIIMILNIVNSVIIFYNGRNVYYRNMNSLQHMTTISEELLTVNREVLMIVSDMGNPMGNVTNIHNSFDNIRKSMKAYEEIQHSDLEKRRYNHAKLLVESYDNKLLNLEHSFAGLEAEQMKNIYLQEIHPTQNAAVEMIMATLEIGKNDAETLMKRNSVFFGVGFIFLFVVLIVSEIIVHGLSKSTKRRMQQLQVQERQIAAAGRKLENSNQKMHDIALTNILTGMKNRYALEDDIAEILETKQFNIAVFDIDNFRIINDTYGYEFGDEYLSAVGEMLDEEFKDSATIYNITSNEFCFIFNDDIPDSQIQRMADRIRATMSTPVTIESITVQCTASGSIYHYLPNDCLNVSSLLLKMDNVMHNAKRNGGNLVYTVNSL
ncbi:MAG: diguanylate cyclase [Ruminococcus sp.]|nr:diguanylate cyclase [Ruminococcus sp.]MDE6677663.1 diguanylate cyclase [Ruminococcus sp.]